MDLPVWLFVPNLIGYGRVVLAFVGYMYALTDWKMTVGAYVISQGLDAADGLAARLLGQSSDFGAVLDMVTDRASTACLCIVLGQLYPEMIFPLTGLIMLDSFSHWFHMHASLKLGLGSHKECTNPLLRFYYRKPVLFAVCSGTEFWYIALYAMHFTEAARIASMVYTAMMPIMLFKQVCNVVQMFVAMTTILDYDKQQRGLPCPPTGKPKVK